MAGGGPEKTHHKVVESVTIMRLVLSLFFIQSRAAPEFSFSCALSADTKLGDTHTIMGSSKHIVWKRLT